MEDIRIQMLIGKLMIPGQYLSSIMAPRCLRAPAVDFLPSLHPGFITPPFSTPQYHVTCPRTLKGIHCRQFTIHRRR